jgi:hypothetical protein
MSWDMAGKLAKDLGMGMKKSFAGATEVADDVILRKMLGETLMNGNKNINSAFGSETMMGGFHATYKNMTMGDKSLGLMDAIKAAHKDPTTGNLNYGTIAGSYLGVSAGYRMASGGGLYKDRKGNTNLIGIPFI